MAGTARVWTRRERLVVGVCLSLLLSACGGAGSGGVLRNSATGQVVAGGSEQPHGLRILTPSLPVATSGEPLPRLQLRAVPISEGHPEAVPAHQAPAVENLVWRVWDGVLPAGVILDERGRLGGTPRVPGVYVFRVHVTDGQRVGVGSLGLAVDDLGLFCASGLVAGDAWGGHPVTVAAAGAAGPVAFETVLNESGGVWRSVDADSGRAVWVPGGDGGDDCVDRLLARDLETGREARLSVPVRADPTEGHAAAFGSTDVWHVNFDRKRGAHPYATDFHAALAGIGFRDPASTGPHGRPADRVAELWLRLETLRHLNLLFLRAADGTAGPSGLPLSFPFAEPGAGYGKPQQGTFAVGAAGRFSEISVVDGEAAVILGTALTDNARNSMHENDTTAGGEDLGVFVNVLSAYFDVMYSSAALRTQFVAESDLAALRALLYDTAADGPRHALLQESGRHFARLLAVVLAHEIGHSLGLPHTDHTAPDSIMSPQAPITPWSKPAFEASDLAMLRARLPGPGRSGLERSPAATLPTGVHVCSGETCHLHLPNHAAPR